MRHFILINKKTGELTIAERSWHRNKTYREVCYVPWNDRHFTKGKYLENNTWEELEVY